MAIPRANVAKCPVCIQDQRLGCSNGQEVKAGRAYSTVSCSTVIPQGQATFPRTWVAEESRTCTALPLTGDEEGLNLPPRRPDPCPSTVVQCVAPGREGGVGRGLLCYWVTAKGQEGIQQHSEAGGLQVTSTAPNSSVPSLPR